MRQRRVKTTRMRHADVCAQINWQIGQQERFIRENCSFFAYVGPVHAFPHAPQVNRSIPLLEIGGLEIGRSEPSYASGKVFALEEAAA